MPSNTAIFALPYPNGSDRPCDFAQQWCDFTDAVQAVLDGFQTTLDRTVPMIPIAVLGVSSAFTMTSFNNIPYDTVVIDSAAWTAVDIDNTMISPDMAGVLSWHASATITQSQIAGAYILDPSDSRGFLTEPNFPYMDQMDNNTATVGIPLPLPVLFSDGGWTPGSSGLRNSVGANVAATVTIQYSNYAVYWHADGGTV
jgi:hypothetical protein